MTYGLLNDKPFKRLNCYSCNPKNLKIPMKKYLIIFLLIITNTTFSQSWLKEMQKPDRNYYSIKKKADKYFKDEIRQAKYQAKHLGKSKKESEEDEGLEGYKIYKRWEEFWKPRINADGTFPAPDIVYQEMMAWEKKHPNSKTQSQGLWTPVGPFTVAAGAGWSPGIGRINGMTVNPQNPNEIYACAPAGGLWKSITGGNNFITTTDNLPSIGFTSVVVDPTNSNIVYAASGDGEAGDTYGLGVLKSTDAGVTWNTTGLSWSIVKANTCHKIVIDPSNPSTLFVGTNAGLFRSTDAAATWTSVLNANIFDLEFKPGNSNIIYAVSTDKYYKSIDYGITFNQITSGLPSSFATSRFAIAVSPAAPGVVYVMAGASSDNGFLGLYKSTDSGDNFNFITNQPNVMGWDMSGNDAGGQSWYTLCIAADPNDADHILTGGVNVWESFDGGQSFFINAHWVINPTSYVHADVHFLDFVGGALYAGTDGGLFKSTNSGASWTDISAGLQVSQFYRLGTSATDPNLIFGGAQDNGGIRFMNGVCDQWIGADGFEQAVHPLNNNIVYGVIQNGGMYKSTDKGNSYTGVGNIPGQGDWNTPFLVDNNGVLYVGYQNIWKSTNNGNSFSQLTPSMGTLKFMAICKSAQNVIYATNGNDIFKVNASTGSVTVITNGLPGVKSYITVADNNPDKIYVTISGFLKNTKVFKSDNGGLTWTNISGNLPNIPANTVACDTSLLEGIYVGTETGVFYRNNNSNDWQLFNNGLPKTIVSELEFNYATNKIRVATYGRGIWESDLYAQTIPAADFEQNRISICPNKDIIFNDISTEGPTSRIWSFPGGIPSSATGKTVVVNYPAIGNYDVSLTVSNSNGTNSITKTQLISVNTTMQQIPFTEGFETGSLQPGWSIANKDLDAFTWGLVMPGSFAASIHSYRCTNFNADLIGSEDELLMAQYDLTSISNPTFTFDVAYGRRSPTSRDTLKVEASIDCGDSWFVLYNKGGNNLKTSPNFFLSNPFVPLSNEWRTESIDLSSISNQSQVFFKFKNISGQGNNIYIDNINIAIAAGIVNTDNLIDPLTISPNPVTDVSSLKLKNNIRIDGELSMKIYNVLGDLISSKQFKNSETELFLKSSDFINGIYFYELSDSKKSIGKGKFIIQ